MTLEFLFAAWPNDEESGRRSQEANLETQQLSYYASPYRA